MIENLCNGRSRRWLAKINVGFVVVVLLELTQLKRWSAILTVLPRVRTVFNRFGFLVYLIILNHTET